MTEMINTIPFNQTVQRRGASRFAQRQIERHRRLAPVADQLVIANENESTSLRRSGAAILLYQVLSD